MKRVGVVIPCYNSEKYLSDAIRSVQAQTLAPSQIVVADDCSTDSSVRVARQMGALVVEQQQNSGPASARNRGVAALCDCDVVAFLDSDDEWTPDHLELLIPSFSNENVGVVHSTTGSLKGGSRSILELSPAPPKHVFEELLASNHVSQSSAVVRLSCFSEVGGYREGARFAEDYDLWLRLALVTQFQFIPQTTSLRRDHEDQASRQTARLLRGALEARTRAISIAAALGQPVSEDVANQTLEQLIEFTLTTAAFHADMSTVDVLLETFPEASDVGRRVRRWRTRNLPAWPWYKAKAILRELLIG